jgi:2-amino-4-hydroxy-6-hydroxymethyldihydropteridine diphosphokinase
MSSGIFIGLGGNLPSQAGGPEATQMAALQRLESAGVAILRRSGWYTSAPVPASDQPWFINAVAQIATSLAPEPLLALLHDIEADFGRERSVLNAARTLDLDLLAYDTMIQEGKAPVLPHPRMHERAFVLAPLAEIAPDWRHPRFKLTSQDLLSRLPAGQMVTILEGAAHSP